ncbi:MULTISPECIES: hypothetical protein [Achromobacter]|uniref:Uncharacterized protein n=1 Tax=Achromobacter spanius TaxID=217203 RepID=A0ABY8GY02_9BURK|nr:MULTISPECIES: hypothetical protein [Achromobacter]WAI81016.1 hypothetical protein N8Z00_15815 [Achromobacter spanius]WEX96534.1 hypothetical protein N3Z32_10420 [Achromobacter sp. SS2-2022]WFP09749.1 hypothetical protein P8T11_07685 [Achromobacter spanius]
MPKGSLSKIEKIHLGTQILTHTMTIIAAVVVAVWGYYSTVYVKKEREVTEYTLKELEQKTAQRPHIQAKVETTVQKLMEGGNLVAIKVTLFNLGNQESRVTLDEHSLVLVPVVFVEGKPNYQSSTTLQSGRYAGSLARIPLNFVDVGAGESHEITFVQKIEKPGVYLIHFLALNGVNPPAEVFSNADVPLYRYAVGADKYLVVN